MPELRPARPGPSPRVRVHRAHLPSAARHPSSQGSPWARPRHPHPGRGAPYAAQSDHVHDGHAVGHRPAAPGLRQGRPPFRRCASSPWPCSRSARAGTTATTPTPPAASTAAGSTRRPSPARVATRRAW